MLAPHIEVNLRICGALKIGSIPGMIGTGIPDFWARSTGAQAKHIIFEAKQLNSDARHICSESNHIIFEGKQVIFEKKHIISESKKPVISFSKQNI